MQTRIQQFKEVSNLHVAHVHPCVNYEWSKIQLKVNSTKSELKLN
jgi:hypothetical protein